MEEKRGDERTETTKCRGRDEERYGRGMQGIYSIETRELCFMTGCSRC